MVPLESSPHTILKPVDGAGQLAQQLLDGGAALNPSLPRICSTSDSDIGVVWMESASSRPNSATYALRTGDVWQVF